MHAQSFVVALLVIACSVYAAWSLMPAAARRSVALALLKMPLPTSLAQALHKHTVAASGCGCDGCDRGTGKAARPAVQAIRFHRRPPR
jgi:hypothetical protein